MNNPPAEINVADIIIEDRLRKEYSNEDGLQESIAENGTIQPLVLEELPDGRMRLLAGGRRITSIKALGLPKLYHGSTYVKGKPGYVLGRELPPDERRLLELEENFKRTEMTWQESCIGVAEVHSLRRMKAAIDGGDWTQKQTARMLGYSGHCQVNYALEVAERLNKSKDDPIWQCTSLMDAREFIWTEQADIANAELARRQSENKIEIVEEEVPTFIQEIEDNLSGLTGDNPNATGDTQIEDSVRMLRLTPYEDLTKEQAKLVYLSGELNPPEKFEEYYAYKQRQIDARNTIDLSKILVHGDSIAFMNDPSNAGRFDHIITDIPYGIDMDMLQQENTGMDVSSTAAEHDEKANWDLIAAFFPAAFACTNDNAFVITWCDAMLFKSMHDTAAMAGFKVQRWPFHWVKPGGMNQAAQYNQTKATEIAIICRKPGATRVVNTGLNYEICGRDELCELIDHPFAKPRVLWERFANEVSIEGQTILDPFMGRGSGPVAMLGIKRNVVGVELKEEHYNAARMNVQNLHFLRLNPKLKFI